jgi:hypothetical protein
LHKKEEFENQFGKLILGILTNDKGGPVFVNNDLEVPRLKSFISSLLISERSRIANKPMMVTGEDASMFKMGAET